MQVLGAGEGGSFVLGDVQVGDSLVTTSDGYLRALMDSEVYDPRIIVAKALETKTISSQRPQLVHVKMI